MSDHVNFTYTVVVCVRGRAFLGVIFFLFKLWSWFICMVFELHRNVRFVHILLFRILIYERRSFFVLFLLCVVAQCSKALFWLTFLLNLEVVNDWFICNILFKLTSRHLPGVFKGPLAGLRRKFKKIRKKIIPFNLPMNCLLTHTYRISINIWLR